MLTGRRRIGKSVALLDTASAPCARVDVDPRQVIHIPCDDMRERDLRRSLTLARELTRSVDIDAAQRRVWLLDEGQHACRLVRRPQGRPGQHAVR
ncbi:MAG: AAA family ATPase [Kineosporiaceae bacterium]